MNDGNSGNDLGSLRRFIRASTAELKRVPQNTDRPLADIFDAFTRAAGSVESPTTEDNQDEIGLRSKFDETLAVGSVVVIYRPHLLNQGQAQHDKIRTALTAILTANPAVDLKAIQDSIGIKIISVHRPEPATIPQPKGFEF